MNGHFPAIEAAAARSWRNAVCAPLDDLAGDDSAAVARLLEEPRIDPRRIGIHGHSQGGTLGPLAAARSPHVAVVNELVAVADHDRPRRRLDSLVTALRDRRRCFAPPAADNGDQRSSRLFGRDDPLAWWARVRWLASRR